MSVVITGRRIQASERFMSASSLCGAYHDLRTVDELKMAVDHYLLSALKSRFQYGFLAERARDLDRHHRGNTGLDDEQVAATLAGLHRRGGHDYGLLLAQVELCVHQRAGPQHLVLVRHR